MAEHVKSMPTLKKDPQTFVAHPVCRSCYVTHKMDHLPTMPFATHYPCAVVQCENPAAYVVVTV